MAVGNVTHSMVQENVRFGAPLAGLVVGLIVLLVGIFQSGLTTLTFVGGIIALAGIVGLAWASFGAVAEPG